MSQRHSAQSVSPPKGHVRHVCSCDDCHSQPFADTCKYEALLRDAAELIEVGMVARLRPQAEALLRRIAEAD
jgi:hypothetical protein